MNLGEAVFKMIAGRTPRTRDESPGAMVRRALGEAGGVSALARSIGVSRTTVQRWNKGSTPTLESQELLRSVLRRADLRDARAARIATRNTLTLRGRQDGRQRTIHLGRYLAPGTMGRAVEAYLRGASAADLHRVVWSGITDQSYRWMFQPPGGVAQSGPSAAPRTPQGASGGGGGGGGSAGRGGGDDDDQDDDGDELDDGYDDDGYDDDYGDLMYEGDVPELDPGYEFSVSSAR